MEEVTSSRQRRLVSLGTTCHVAQLLKEANRKPESTPFDWIFSTPAAVAHMLEDDFACFLDRSRYTDHREATATAKRAGHARYHDRMFNHHDPRDPTDHAYFERCVDRFRRLLVGDTGLLFVLGHMNQRGGGNVATYARVWEALQRCKAGAALLALHHVANEGNGTITELHVQPGFRIVEMSGSRSDGRHFANPSDEALLRDLVASAEASL